MIDEQNLEVIWGETANIRAKDGAEETTKRLNAVVAKMVIDAHNRGLDHKYRRIPAPRATSPELPIFNAMSTTAEQVDRSLYTGNPLPARAVLYEVTITGVPRVDGDLPESIKWITDAGVRHGGDFVVKDGADGRVYRLFESDKVPEGAELPFVSAVSGSGLPAPVMPNPYTGWAWWLAFASVFFFLSGAELALVSGHSMSASKSILVSKNPAIQATLVNNIGDICKQNYEAYPDGAMENVCKKLLVDDPNAKPEDRKKDVDLKNAQEVLALAQECPTNAGADGCVIFWRAAVKTDQDSPLKQSYFDFASYVSSYFLGSASPMGSTSIVLPFLLLIGGIGGLTIALGLGVNQRLAGVWIDGRNRVSLARAQATLWTIVILAGYAAFSMFNIGYASILADPGAAIEIFPSMDTAVLAVLGIAAGSPMLSALILAPKNKKPGADPQELAVLGGDQDQSKRGMPFFGTASGGLDKRSSPLEASLADIFMGEEKVNATTIDISRLQNVVLTMLLVLGYFSLLVERMGNIAMESMLTKQVVLFGSMPGMDGTFTSLLFASHATYLVAKAYDNPDMKPGVQKPGEHN